MYTVDSGASMHVKRTSVDDRRESLRSGAWHVFVGNVRAVGRLCNEMDCSFSWRARRKKSKTEKKEKDC